MKMARVLQIAAILAALGLPFAVNPQLSGVAPPCPQTKPASVLCPIIVTLCSDCPNVVDCKSTGPCTQLDRQTDMFGSQPTTNMTYVGQDQVNLVLCAKQYGCHLTAPNYTTCDENLSVVMQPRRLAPNVAVNCPTGE
jgi:hypothetical protein